MITLRATVGALLLLLTAVGTAAAKLDAPSDVRILAYDVSLDLDFSAKTVVGAETITVQSLIDGLESMSFSTNSAAVTPNLDDRAGLIESMIEGNRRILRFVRPLSLGQIAHISFVFHPTDGKGVVFGPDFVYANYFTCSVIICDQDYPAAKAPVDFSLSTPAGMRAVAPGRRTKRFTVAGRTYWSWHDDRPTAPYLLGFAAGKFHAVRLPGRGPRLTVLATDPSARRVRKMFADTRRMLRFFERVSGVRYESAPYTQVLVPGDEAQEAARHSIIGTDEIEPILKDPQEDWVIAHELAHQWWGNSLTCADWSELWLNEGLTVFMVAAYKEQRWGRAAYDRELELAHKRWDAAKAQNFDVPLSWQGEYPSLKLKRAMAYAKAVVFLDKLRSDLGDEAFWRAIKTYTTDHRNGVVTALDLEQAFEAASGQNLAPLFAEWVFGPAVPQRDTP